MIFAKEFRWLPADVDQLQIGEARLLADMIRRQAEFRDHMYIPVDDATPTGMAGTVMEHDGKTLVKVPRQLYENYQQARQAAEIVWAVLHASPKFRGAKKDDIVPAPPWGELLKKARFEKGLKQARANGLAPPAEVREIERPPDKG